MPRLPVRAAQGHRDAGIRRPLRDIALVRAESAEIAIRPASRLRPLRARQARGPNRETESRVPSEACSESHRTARKASNRSRMCVPPRPAVQKGTRMYLEAVLNVPPPAVPSPPSVGLQPLSAPALQPLLSLRPALFQSPTVGNRQRN